MTKASITRASMTRASITRARRWALEDGSSMIGALKDEGSSKMEAEALAQFNMIDLIG